MNFATMPLTPASARSTPQQRRLPTLCGALLCLALVALAPWVQAEPNRFDYRLDARPVAENVFVFIGAREDFNRENGGNIVNTGFIVAEQGIIVIDTGPSLRYGEQMRAAIAQVSPRPVVYSINTHAHPDHFLGNQAFAESTLAALPDTQRQIARSGEQLAENLYRLSGDWMKGTSAVPPTQPLAAGEQVIAGRRLQLIALTGHTGADLVVFDLHSGVLFTGDLLFHGRAPTTPHADIPQWLESLAQLEVITRDSRFRWLVPGHGLPTQDSTPIQQTRAWLLWLQQRLRDSAEAGLSMNETLQQPLPPEFATLPLAQVEYRRSVERYYPAAEMAALRAAPAAR